MSKPLQEKASTKSAAAAWHKAVFLMFGQKCFFCGHNATDAAHVVKRSRIGAKLAYCDPRIGRSLCRKCHCKQEVGEISFPLNVRQEAIEVHNIFARVKLPVPGE